MIVNINYIVICISICNFNNNRFNGTFNIPSLCSPHLYSGYTDLSMR